ncbi:MAG TPA: TetR/AcrR family transcriptional regulator [Acidimicrobiales bacterium]|nr:TetR/AcrR family transcriptional regulator [Acidimicrobiales bacterium]
MVTAGGRTRKTLRRRADILAAALDTIVETGESGMFVQKVCARAGVSVGTLYHHFGSKDLLLATLHYSLLNDYQSGAGAILAADPRAELGIKDTVDYHLRWLVRHPRPATFLLQHPFAGYRSDDVAAELLDENAEFLAVVKGWLDKRMAGGELRKLPFETVTAVLIGPVHHWVRSALYRGVPSQAAVRSASLELSGTAWEALRPADLRSPHRSGTRRKK